MKSIGFKDYLIREIILENKTVTRRLIKPEPYSHDQALADLGYKMPLPLDIYAEFLNKMQERKYTSICTKGSLSGMMLPDCKYGKVGDVIYVKETYAKVGDRYVYKLDNPDLDVKWISGMFMPERAARLFLKIKSIVPEKLHDITKEQAIMEGVKKKKAGYTNYIEPESAWFVYKNPIDSFQSLWVKINGAGSWQANPAVFAIEFEIHEFKK